MPPSTGIHSRKGRLESGSGLRATTKWSVSTATLLSGGWESAAPPRAPPQTATLPLVAALRAGSASCAAVDGDPASRRRPAGGLRRKRRRRRRPCLCLLPSGRLMDKPPLLFLSLRERGFPSFLSLRER